MADYPTAAVDRLGDYNGARYDAQTNPFGFAIGGHRQNFPAALNDTALVVNYVGEAATEIAAFAQQTAQDRAQTGQDRQAAAASAAAAATFDPALFARLIGATFTGLVSFFVGTSARAGLNLGQRGTAPTGPANGDVWSLASGLWGYFGGVTRQFYDTATLPAPTNAEIDAGTNTLRKAWSVLDVFRAARAALPAMTQAIAEAGSDTVARSISALAVRQAAVAADTEVLVASYTGAQLSGLSQVVLDLPNGFSTFRLVVANVASGGAVGNLTLRCGVAGGSLNAGASDYSNVTHGQDGSSTIAATGTAAEATIGSVTGNAITSIETVINDGSGGGFWNAMTTEGGQNPSGQYRIAKRFGAFTAAVGARKRLGILSSVAFANSGSIKIYGVR